MELAQAAPAYAAPIAGRSLAPDLRGEASADGVIGEYLGEAAVAPLVMVRRGRWKFIHCPVDPDQLYDLEADPEEVNNLATAFACAAVVADFKAEVTARWDLGALHQKVLASQARRRLVSRALFEGRHTAWDHQPIRDASTLFMRNTIKLDDLERRARFPKVSSAGT
jgi:choline-sulfatase